jgi:hypothetical protein
MSANRNTLIIELHMQGASHAEISRHVGISRERVRQILRSELGASKPVIKQPEIRRSIALAIYFAMENGSDLDTAIKLSGLNKNTISNVIQEQLGYRPHILSFAVWMSGEIGKRYNNWLITGISPGSENSYSKARCKVRARCMKCGVIYTVNHANIATGCSTMCASCGRKMIKPKPQPVEDSLTGNVYGSIQEAARELGLTYNQARYRSKETKAAPALIRLQS